MPPHTKQQLSHLDPGLLGACTDLVQHLGNAARALAEANVTIASAELETCEDLLRTLHLIAPWIGLAETLNETRRKLSDADFLSFLGDLMELNRMLDGPAGGLSIAAATRTSLGLTEHLARRGHLGAAAIALEDAERTLLASGSFMPVRAATRLVRTAINSLATNEEDLLPVALAIGKTLHCCLQLIRPARHPDEEGRSDYAPEREGCNQA